MDSLTQIVLGAAVGEACLGKKLGNKALLLGAIGGTLPDLDVFLNGLNDDPLWELKVHRGYSHSILVHFLIALPLAWLSHRWTKKARAISKKRWYWFWLLALGTHALLDCCTTYGTRLFLPITDYLVAFNNISVVDPLYTLPFLLLLIVMMCYPRVSRGRKKWFYAAIAVSSTYMLLTFALKGVVHQKFQESLLKNKIAVQNLNSSPTIFNAILWAGMAHDRDSFYVAEYSFLRPEVPIEWLGYPRDEKLLNRFESEDLETTLWFADDMYFMTAHGSDSMRFYVAKFGRMNLLEKDAPKAFMWNTLFFRNSDGEIQRLSQDPKEARPDGEEMKVYFRALLEKIGI